jgi:hypothetical protein
MPCPTHLFLLDHSNYGWRGAPHYAVFSILLSLHLSSVKILSSTPCPETPSIYVPALMSETKFHTHTELQAK